MKVQISVEQAQRIVLFHRELQAAAVRLNEAANLLAPGIKNGTLHEEDGVWYLTDEVVAQPEVEAAEAGDDQ